MASMEDSKINPRAHHSRSSGHWLYDWWRRFRIYINLGLLTIYVLIMHWAGVLEMLSAVFYGEQDVPVYDQGDARWIIVKSLFGAAITWLFVVALFYVPSGRINKKDDALES